MAVSPILDRLQRIYEQFVPLRTGKVADYIPELSKANPEWFGITIMTRDGHLYEVGDTNQHFTIQSISKPLTYGLALEDRGEDEVLKRIGVEPSGDAFNAISLRPNTGAPMNPMINAGAIAACGMIEARKPGEKFNRILGAFSKYAGRKLDIDSDVYYSESNTGHRNRAIGWMLRNFDIVDREPGETLETYFRQCSIRVTCRDLATIGATLANGGVNPATGERAVAGEFVDNILSVMTTCGMYDYSGEWIYQVGLPAKSGVGGGILAVLPGQLGIGVFSPPLDDQGNSARGIAVCRELSRALGLHMLSVSTPPATSIRSIFDRQKVASKRRRTPVQSEYLRSVGSRIRGYQLQGALTFGMIEPLVRDISTKAGETDFFIVNFRSVLHIDAAAAHLLEETRQVFAKEGKKIFFTQIGELKSALVAAGTPEGVFFPDNDRALELCENELLAKAFKDNVLTDHGSELGKTPICDGLTPDEISRLDVLLPSRRYPAGAFVVHRGDKGDELFILLRGSVTVGINDGATAQRFDVFSAGMHFGEMAFLDSAPRSADVVSDSEIVCRILTREAFDEIGQTDPTLKIKLMHNLMRGLTRNLRQNNLQIEALA